MTVGITYLRISKPSGQIVGHVTVPIMEVVQPQETADTFYIECIGAIPSADLWYYDFATDQLLERIDGSISAAGTVVLCSSDSVSVTMPADAYAEEVSDGMYSTSICGDRHIRLLGKYRGSVNISAWDTLEQAQRFLHDKINSIKRTKMNQPAPWNGKRWDTDQESQSRLLSVLRLSALPAGFYWTSADNEDVVVTLEDLQNLLNAGILYINAIHQASRNLKNSVDAATTIEELRAVDLSAEWPSEE